MDVSQTLLKVVKTIVLIILLIVPAHGLNVGLIAGDLKRHSNPLIIRKVSKLSPVIININSGLPKLSKSFSPLPKLPTKPLFKLPEQKLPKPKRSVLSPFPPFLLPPLIPRLPILPILPIFPPIIPPLLPPLIPRLPIMPLRILPPVLPLSKFKDPLKALRVPILEKSPLLKTLHPKIKSLNIKGDILAKLLDLKIKGSLTTPEFIRFKKLLVK